MPRRSPLRSQQPGAVSVCGKLLQKGQTITVLEQAIGPRERRMEKKGKIRIRRSNQPGKVQVTCVMK